MKHKSAMIKENYCHLCPFIHSVRVSIYTFGEESKNDSVVADWQTGVESPDNDKWASRKYLGASHFLPLSPAEMGQLISGSKTPRRSYTILYPLLKHSRTNDSPHMQPIKILN